MTFTTKSKKTGKTYFLHKREIHRVRGSGSITLYYFAGQEKEGSIEAIPAGYEIGENSKTGLPFLQKIK